MTENTDDRPRTIRLRIVNPESTTSNPADVTAIGLAEMEVCDKSAVIGAVRSETFDGDRTCTRADLVTAAIWPEPVDILVTYDLSRTLELVPPDATDYPSWIGVGRLLVQFGCDVVDKPAERVATEMGMGKELALMTTDGSAVSSAAVATALLAALLYSKVGWSRMLWLSRDKTRPLRSVPGIDDTAGWAAMPRDDLDWVADRQPAFAWPNQASSQAVTDDVTDRAVRELTRRRSLADRA